MQAEGKGRRRTWEDWLRFSLHSVLQPWEEDDHVVQVRVDCEERVQEVDRGSGVLQVQRDKLEAVALRGVVPRGGQVVERLQVVLPGQVQLL